MNKTVFSLSDILMATKGQCLFSKEANFAQIATDTRVLKKGDFFIALKGDRFDAHDFILDAIRQNKLDGVMVHEWRNEYEEFKTACTWVLVKDTLEGLTLLAQFHRRRLPATVIGITGSNGKTTTKEFTKQICSQYKNVYASPGSLNNHWGLPLTLLAGRIEHEVLICEMGMNHKDEIRHLVQIAEPDVVVCTMVGRAHLEALGSVQAISEAKEEIYQYAPPSCKRVYNLDNPWTHSMWDKHSAAYPQAPPPLTFGALSEATDKVSDVEFSLLKSDGAGLSIMARIQNEEAEMLVPVFGEQNLVNLMAASSLALAVGLRPQQILSALPSCRTSWGRNQLVELKSGASVLFDAYNANPDSLKALLDNIKKVPLGANQRLYGIFGQMLELGDKSEELHSELGALVGELNFAKVFFVANGSTKEAEAFKEGFDAKRDAKMRGQLQSHPLMKDSQTDVATGGVPLPQLELLVQFTSDPFLDLQKVLRKGDLVTIKGSRGIKLERALDLLLPKNVAD